MFELLFTVTVKSELTGREGSSTIKIDPRLDDTLDVFYEAVRECLSRIAGETNGEDEEGSLPS